MKQSYQNKGLMAGEVGNLIPLAFQVFGIGFTNVNFKGISKTAEISNTYYT